MFCDHLQQTKYQWGQEHFVLLSPVDFFLYFWWSGSELQNDGDNVAWDRHSIDFKHCNAVVKKHVACLFLNPTTFVFGRIDGRVDLFEGGWMDWWCSFFSTNLSAVLERQLSQTGCTRGSLPVVLLVEAGVEVLNREVGNTVSLIGDFSSWWQRCGPLEEGDVESCVWSKRWIYGMRVMKCWVLGWICYPYCYEQWL